MFNFFDLPKCIAYKIVCQNFNDSSICASSVYTSCTGLIIWFPQMSTFEIIMAFEHIIDNMLGVYKNFA